MAPLVKVTCADRADVAPAWALLAGVLEQHQVGVGALSDGRRDGLEELQRRARPR